MKKLVAFCLMVGAFFGATNAGLAQDQEKPVSTCLAVANNLKIPEAQIIFASATASPLAVQGDVTISFAGHSTYRIQSPEGVVIATDFSGLWGAVPTLPRVVTMNRAHSSHFTMNPDPGIEYVLPGWGIGDAEPADHDVLVDDVYIRNVTTDIRSFGDGMMADGNSIFIFEIAGLCIGHLGHLHHPLTDDHFAEIGRLDIVMIPVDGGLTLSHSRMADLTKRLRSSIVLPMHLRGNRIDSFINMMGSDWAVDFMSDNTIEVNIRSLPKRPTIMVPFNLRSRG